MGVASGALWGHGDGVGGDAGVDELPAYECGYVGVWVGVGVGPGDELRGELCGDVWGCFEALGADGGAHCCDDV